MTIESLRKARTARIERGLAFVGIVAGAWSFVDAFVFGQGMIAFILCAVAVLYLLPRAISARKSQELFRLRLAKAAITAAAGVLVFVVISFNNSLARERAEGVIAAVEGFHARHARYPDSLEQLVPDFMPEVPAAKVAFGGNRFTYFSSPERHTLMYVVLPPFGREFYDFDRRAWSYLD